MVPTWSKAWQGARRATRVGCAGLVTCVALMAVGLFVGGVGAGSAWADEPPMARPGQAALPNVVGQAQDRAVQALEALGLDVLVVTVVDPLVGRVLGQVPRGGSALAGLGVVRLHVGTTATAQVVVPNCVGMALGEARALLEPLFFCEIVEVDAAGPRAGTVLRQDPAAGRQLGFRARLRVEVARAGPEVNVVPPVLGLGEDEARVALEDAGLRVEVTYVDEPGLPAGRVSVQDPRAGAQALPGATARLRVVAGTGAGPAQVRVPDLVRLPLDIALQVLVALDLVAQPTYQMTDSGRMYVVLEQGIAPQQRVARGSRIPLTISRPRLSPARLRVPPVVGLTQAEATTLLDGAGLGTSVVTRLSPLPVGTVIESRPAGGTDVASSSLVTLVVARRGGGSPGRTLITVPELVGLTQARARQDLFDRGLMAGVLLTQAPDAPVDVVTEQRPVAGTQVEAGSGVTIYVPDTTRMPDLVGMGLVEARATLQDRNLNANEERLGIGGLPQSVVGQEPAAGVRITTGSTVTVRHRRDGAGTGPGPLPGSGVEVPDLVGLSEQEARDIGLARGFGLSLIGLPGSALLRRQARVQSQDPPGGTRVPRGASITLDFADRGGGGGVRPLDPGGSVTVPPFTGLSESEARDSGLGAGLSMSFRNLPSSPGQRRLARVIGQTPAAGTRVPWGSQVTLDFGGRGTLTPTLVLVPNVVGMDFPRAVADMTAAGLTVVRQPLGTGVGLRVIAQGLPAGQLVPRGTTIELTPSSGGGGGAGALVMPDMVGWTSTRARAWAEERGLPFSESTVDLPVPGQARVVRHATPAAGAPVERAIGVYVIAANQGGLPPPPAVDIVTVPNVVGMALPAAMRRISDEGLLPQVPVSTDLINPVRSQAPVAGTRVPRGSIVELTFR